jgi:hypothetical protein
MFNLFPLSSCELKDYERRYKNAWKYGDGLRSSNVKMHEVLGKMGGQTMTNGASSYPLQKSGRFSR